MRDATITPPPLSGFLQASIEDALEYLANLVSQQRRIADALEVIAHESEVRQRAAAREAERAQEREAEAYRDRAQWIAETQARLADDHCYVTEDEQSDLAIARAQQRHIEATRPEIVQQAKALAETEAFDGAV